MWKSFFSGTGVEAIKLYMDAKVEKENAAAKKDLGIGALGLGGGILLASTGAFFATKAVDSAVDTKNKYESNQRTQADELYLRARKRLEALHGSDQQITAKMVEDEVEKIKAEEATRSCRIA